MIWTIVRKELLVNLLSLRFALGLVLTVAMMGIVSYVLLQDYAARRQTYIAEAQRHQEELAQTKVYSLVKVVVDVPPSPLSMFSRGVQGLPTSFEVSAYQIPALIQWEPYWAWTLTRGANTAINLEDTSDRPRNPLLRMFSTLDLGFVISTILSLFAVLLVFDSFSGEREQGTLSLLMANPVGRLEVLAGKFIGALITIAVPLTLGFLAVLLLWGMGCGEGKKESPTEPPDGQSSLFADSHLEAAVREALLKPTGTLSPQVLLSLTQLSARGRGIADLKGIELLKGLTTLNLADNQIRDLAPLDSLTQLTYLDLSNNQVQDLSALSGLKQLQTLVLDYNQVQDIGPLAGLTQLRRLGVIGNPLNEVARTTQVPALQARGVQVNVALFADAGLEAAVREAVRQASGSLSTDTLLTLSQLTAMGRGIVDLRGIGQLHNLQTLNLADNQIQDITPLTELLQLTYLDLSHNPVQDLSPLSGLAHLGTLLLDSTAVQDLSPLIGLGQLRRVGLVGAPLSDAARTAQVPALRARGVQVNLGASASPSGAILFLSGFWPAIDLYTMNPDGSNLVRLTHDVGGVGEAVWSADNSRIAFVGNPYNGSGWVYVMNADGSGLVQLTNDAQAKDSQLAWSPDNRRIAFVRQTPQITPVSYVGGPGEIYVMNADGTGLTNASNSAADDWWPSWSPDGSRLLFTSDRGGKYDLCLMDPDGSHVVQLTSGAAQCNNGSWSPDGSKIALFRDGRLHVMDADGSHVTQLVDLTGSFSGFAWSPDGSRFAFSAARDMRLMEIYVVWSDGTGLQRLTNNAVYDGGPVWSPDGTRLAFSTNRDGNYEIYVMDADGSNPIRLTNGSAADSPVAWR